MYYTIHNTQRKEKIKMNTKQTTINTSISKALEKVAARYGEPYAHRLKKEIDGAEDFRPAHDPRGGMSVAEFQMVDDIIDDGDPWAAITTLYDLAWKRGYKRGERVTKERYKKRLMRFKDEPQCNN